MGNGALCTYTRGEREREKEREFQKVDPAAEKQLIRQVPFLV